MKCVPGLASIFVSFLGFPSIDRNYDPIESPAPAFFFTWHYSGIHHGISIFPIIAFISCRAATKTNPIRMDDDERGKASR